MFPWSKKIRKSVEFNRGLADQSLLEVVESELEKQPHKTFSDLCKEALWQYLCVPESVRPSFRTGSLEQQVAELQHQFADLEQRFFAKESNRLEAMERQLNQLTQQLAQLALIVNQQPTPIPPTQLTPASSAQLTPVSSAQLQPTAEAMTPTPPQEVDPLLSRLSQVLDDF
jgi:hypothetical protein